MNKAIKSLNPVHVFLFCSVIAVIPFFLFALIASTLWLVPVFIVICLIDYFRGTDMRKKAGLILAAILLASIFGFIISYLTQLL